MNSGNIRGRKVFAWILFATLMAASLFQPLAWIVIWFVPIPLIVFSVTNRLVLPTVMAAVCALCLLATGYGFASFLFAGAAFFISFVMADSIKTQESPFAPLITGALVFVMIELVLLSLIHWLGYNIPEMLKMSLQAEANRGMVGGVSPEHWNRFISQVTTEVHLLLPGAICIWAIVMAAVNLLGARLILRGIATNQGPVFPQPLLFAVRIPYAVAVVYMICLGCMLTGLFQTAGWVSQFTHSAALVGGFLMAIQGISYLWRRLQRVPGNGVILLIMLVLGVAYRWIGDIYMLIGLIDMVSYTRRRDV